ncbi:MAG: hypothetical protein E4H09_02395, partial [Spirochaetales bacterium]
MTVTTHERDILRDLARQYVEVCNADRNSLAAGLWRRHNSLLITRPLVIVSSFWDTVNEVRRIFEPARTEIFQDVEDWLKRMIWQGSCVDDDTVFNPWYTVDAPRQLPKVGVWGIEREVIRDSASRGWRCMPVVRSIEDLERLEATPHRVLEKDCERTRQLREILGDILPVHENRSTIYPVWGGTDLSEMAGALFGIEELLYLLYDDPAMVHHLMGFMRDAVISNLSQGEGAGDWSTAEHNNYFMPPFVHGLPDPAPNSHGARLKDLWFFTHAQEFEVVGREQHEEFLLQYQMPIMKLFGLVNYGCCETLDGKIDMLRQIPNLRRICIGPNADVRRSAEQVGRDYVLSWRPSPVMVGPGYS